MVLFAPLLTTYHSSDLARIYTSHIPKSVLASFFVRNPPFLLHPLQVLTASSLCAEIAGMRGSTCLRARRDCEKCPTRRHGCLPWGTRGGR